MPRPIGRLCVFCGSRPGARPEYLDQARRVGELLVERNFGLVYGGASVGLMGAVADAVLSGGGGVIGVIPEALALKELAHRGVRDLRVVGSMHQRKALMAELSDGFIALPGGFGTFEELFEMVTWSQLGLHRKPFGVLNVAGFYDGLLALVDHAIEEGFIPGEHRGLILASGDADELMDLIAGYEPPPPVVKWIRPDQT
jgi:uncharacterized protein (TIGR00730 family)